MSESDLAPPYYIALTIVSLGLAVVGFAIMAETLVVQFLDPTIGLADSTSGYLTGAVSVLAGVSGIATAKILHRHRHRSRRGAW